MHIQIPSSQPAKSESSLTATTHTCINQIEPVDEASIYARHFAFCGDRDKKTQKGNKRQGRTLSAPPLYLLTDWICVSAKSTPGQGRRKSEMQGVYAILAYACSHTDLLVFRYAHIVAVLDHQHSSVVGHEVVSSACSVMWLFGKHRKFKKEGYEANGERRNGQTILFCFLVSNHLGICI